jgi:hypothetical protein
MTALAKIALVIAIDIPIILLRGYVLFCLWGWFAVPLSAPVATMGQLIGLSILISTFRMKVETKKQPDPDMVHAVIDAVFKTLAFWGMGWIVHLVIS